MASITQVSEFIQISHEKFFECDVRQKFYGEQYLFLKYSYTIDGEDLERVIWETTLKFSECEYSSIRMLVEWNEPLPMDSMVNPEVAEVERDLIADAVSSLLHDCEGIEGLKALQANVIVELNWMEEEYVFTTMDDGEVLGEGRMSLCSVVEGKKGKNDANCAICLDEMRGEQEIVCTPCFHQFHRHCLSRWFKGNHFCPLCRFNVEPF